MRTDSESMMWVPLAVMTFLVKARVIFMISHIWMILQVLPSHNQVQI